MATIHADPGGEYYFSLAMAGAITAGIWNENNGISLVNTGAGGRNAASDGKVYALGTGSGSQNVGKYFASSYSHLIAGYALYSPSSSWAAGQVLIGFTNGTTIGTTQCDVRLADSSGHLEITRNGTVLGSVSSAVLTPGWHYIELDVTFATSGTGTADLWVDGVRWIHSTSVQTANTVATANRVYFGNAVTTTLSYFKDMYILDGATSPNTAPLGDIAVAVKYPTGAGSHSAWAANVGPFTLTSVNTTGVYQGTITGGASNAYVGMKFTVTGFVNGANNQTSAICTASTATALTLGGTTVSETHAGSAAFDSVVQDGIAHTGTWPDGDTTYISDSTINDISDFAHESLTLTGSIFAVVHASYMRKDDAGSRSAGQVCVSGGTTEVGPTIALGNSYAYFFDFLDNDPNTSAAWSASNFNSATFGAKILS